MSARALARTLVLVGLGACGPSVSAIYESNARFEHCERLDLDSEVVPSHRRACWEEWSQRYTVGQTTDRFEHARQRIAALDRGETATLRLELTEDAGADGATPTRGLDPSRAPPSIAPVSTPSASATVPVAASATPSAPEQGCERACQDAAARCQDTCRAKGDTVCQRCAVDLQRCQERCPR